MSVDILLAKQNADGGWAYSRGGSWTEPTVYAVLALLASGEKEASRRGIAWLRKARRTDGAWPPRMGVDESNWTTGLVALLPPEELGRDIHGRAIEWLLAETGKESSRAHRWREWLLGHQQPKDQQYPGWPWVPGTAAWVGPTSIAILALKQEERRRPSRAVSARIREGQGFLLARMCHGGGWNHGAAQSLGYAAQAYPETTGMALAALHGVDDAKVKQSTETALAFLGECRSADALNWLRIGLRAQGALPPAFCAPGAMARRTVCETSLDLLVTCAEQQARGVFEEKA